MNHRVLKLFLSVAAVGLLLFGRRFDLVIVHGESMEPTFSTGDLLVIDSMAYAGAEPRRGQIVVARHENELIVKRVVGLPGEEVEIASGVLIVNGSPVLELYPVEPGMLSIGRGRLGYGRYAVVGDNRNYLPGTAIHGILGKEAVAGQVRLAVSIRRFWRMVTWHG